MIGFFIKVDCSDEKYVLTNSKSSRYPDLQKIDSDGSLISLKTKKKAKDKAKELYKIITGSAYPLGKKDNTNKILKKLYNKIIESEGKQ